MTSIFKVSFLFIFVAVFSLNTHADLDPYQEAKETFSKNHSSRMRAYYDKPFPSIEESPFWGMLVKNIAALELGLPIDEAAALTGMNLTMSECRSVEALDECSDLQWPLLVRFYFLANREGQSQMSAKLKEKILEFFALITTKSRLTGLYPVATAGAIWKGINDSENHHACIQSALYFAALALSDSPQYQNTLFDGLRPQQLAKQWGQHWDFHFRERIRRGLLNEVNSHVYSKYTLAAYLNFVDFSATSALKELSRDIMNLIVATAAVESLPNGARGGSQSRKTPVDSIGNAFFSSIYNAYMTSFPMLSGQMAPAFLSSSYFPSRVTWMMYQASSKRSYQVLARTPGVLTEKTSQDVDPSRAVFRTTYVTPDYVLGSTNLDFNHNYYTRNSSESRTLQLLVNEGNTNGNFKDVPQILFGPGGYFCFDRAVGLQKRNVLIFQNNIDFFLHAGEEKDRCYGKQRFGAMETISSTRINSSGLAVNLNFPFADRHDFAGIDQTFSNMDVRFSGFSIVSQSQELGIFLESKDKSTYVWLRPVASEFKILEGYQYGARNATGPVGLKDLVLTKDKFSPIVVVVARSKNYGNSITSFQREMRLNEVVYANQKVSYTPPLRASLEDFDLFVDSRNAQVTGNWERVTDPLAYDGRALKAIDDTARLTMDFNIEKTGYYQLKARVKGADGGSDSFYVQLDSGVRQTFHFERQGTSYNWTDMNVFDGVNRVYLTKGLHKLTLTFREAGAHFDSLVVLHKQNGMPETLEYVENIDRGQPESTIGGTPISLSYTHNQFTHRSPFIRSLKDSGRWELQMDGFKEIIDINQ